MWQRTYERLRGNQLFTWRRLMAQGALTAAGAGEEVVPASELRAAHQQIRELQRLLGKKTLENERRYPGPRA
jgi:transposase